jgi:hypothetical protein
VETADDSTFDPVAIEHERPAMTTPPTFDASIARERTNGPRSGWAGKPEGDR